MRLALAAFLGLIFLGGCVNNAPPENTQPVSEDSNPQTPSNQPAQESQSSPSQPTETDPLFVAQSEAEQTLLREELIRKTAIEKTKPISYERSIVQNPEDVKHFIETWSYLETQNPQSVPFNDPHLAYVKTTYENLLNASKKCCTSGLSSELERENIDREKIFEFLKNDYNFYRVGELCYFYSKDDINTIFNRSDSVREMVTRVQKNCLCLNKKSLKEKTTFLYALLNHKAIDRRTLVYKAYDEFGRQTNRYIVSDIQNIDSNTRCCIQK